MFNNISCKLLLRCTLYTAFIVKAVTPIQYVGCSMSTSLRFYIFNTASYALRIRCKIHTTFIVKNLLHVD